MKKLKIVVIMLLCFIVSVKVNSTAFATENPDEQYIEPTNTTDEETLIKQYIELIESKNWDEYVSLFNYDDETKNDLLEFLQNHQNSKEGIHGIESIKLVSLNLLDEDQFNIDNKFAYEVLLNTKVSKESEFYMNGITKHTFVFTNTGDNLKIETIYFQGLANNLFPKPYINNSGSDINATSALKSLPNTIKLYDTSKSQLKTLSFSTYLKDVMPNEIYVSWPTEALKANILAAKTYAWYNILYPRKPATDYNAHVTDNYQNYQHYKEGSNHATTNQLVDDLSKTAMIRGDGPFDAQYRAGTSGNKGTQSGNVLSQNGTVVLAKEGKTYIQILKYYYTNISVTLYGTTPTPLS